MFLRKETHLDPTRVQGPSTLSVNVVFVHGLVPGPLIADECNSLVGTHLRHVLRNVAPKNRIVKFSYESVNYATLLHASQVLRHRRLSGDLNTDGLESVHANLKTTMPKAIKRPWIDFTSLLRILPHRVLHSGLSFWGDDIYRKSVLSLVNMAVDQVTIPDDQKELADDTEILVLMGYSMGATILLEYLSESSLIQLTDHGRRKVLFLSMGSAVNWHHSTQPFFFKPLAGEVEWINLRYATDTLATGAWSENPTFLHPIRDICFDVFGGTECAAGIKTPSLDDSESFAMPFNERKVAGDELDAVTITQIARYPTGPVMFKNEKHHHFVFVYVHGMSSPIEIAHEWKLVHDGFLKTCRKSGSQVSAEVHGLLYGNMLKPIMRIHERTLGEKRINPVAWDFDLYRGMKRMVLMQFPVALAFWSEPQFRQIVIDDAAEELNFLVSRVVREEAQRSHGVQAEVHVVMMGYATGSLPMLLSLGEFQRRFGNDSYSMFGRVRAVVDGAVTLGAPLSWFGSVGQLVTLGSLPVFPTDARMGWKNYWFLEDIFANPVEEAEASEYVQNLAMENHQPFSQKSLLFKSAPAYAYLALRGTLTFLTGVSLPAREAAACLNGMYLDEAQVWEDIASFMKTCIE
ncbi:hypothetical protein BC830DRAFT_1164971 [Chytriomyces sp. MP71]|nr:hypothetical protein BC830DRAFT_1164971 [Chytriomyces sp. MP71]